MIRRLLVAALALPLLLSACVQASCACATPPLRVFAASSLNGVMDDIKDARTGLGGLIVSTGASSTLRTQIEQGAPVDVFISADVANPQALVDAGLTIGDVRHVASNTLVVVIPADNPAHIASPADLGRVGVRVVAAGVDAPITKYATQVVAKLAALEGYPADFAAAYDANIVSREDNVGAVLAKVALGEGDAALVYVTDPAGSDDVTTIPIPDEANVVADYGAVEIKRPIDRKGYPAALIDWLLGPEGQQVFRDHGFAAPR